MKKIKLALVLVIALTTMMLTACGEKCARCGESGADNKFFGEYYCDDCMGF